MKVINVIKVKVIDPNLSNCLQEGTIIRQFNTATVRNEMKNKKIVDQ